MISLDFEARRLGWLLGLGDLERADHCHGYANCCGCSDCQERAEAVNAPRDRVALPWELDARDAA